MPVLKNARHERFAQELAKGKSADEAYQTAGFKPNRGNASKMKANQIILKRLEEIQERMTTAIVINREYVVDRLKQNVERAMQFEEVKDTKGNGTGEFRYEGSVANKALELLGKDIGMFKERVEHSGTVTLESLVAGSFEKAKDP